MRDLNEMMNEIDDKKDMIAKAISLAFCEGDEEKSKTLFPSFLHSIESSRVGIIKTNNSGKTEYERDIDDILDKLSSILGADVKSLFYSESLKLSPDSLMADSASSSSISPQIEKKLARAYKLGGKVFFKLGISYESFVNFYNLHGDIAFDLAGYAKILRKKMFLFNYKKAYFYEKEKIDVREFVDQFGDIVDEYKVTSIEDFMELYTEICSVLTEDINLNEEQKKIIEENKNRLYKRNNSCFIHDQDFIYLKKRIEQLYNNYWMNKCLRESNINDIICRNGLVMDKQVFQYFVSFYGYIHHVDGFNVYSKLNGKIMNFTFINDLVFNRTGEKQDLVIIHEFIHCLEPIKKDSKPFNVECKAFNEALTQFFAREACKYMESNIISDNYIEEDNKVYISAYDCMLPLVEILKDSVLWEDIVHCKLMNDYSLLRERIGVYASKISKIFDIVYSKSQNGLLNNEEFHFYKLEVTNIVKEIPKKSFRYRKISNP